MTTTSPAGVNGRSRKSLEHQLDRFDSILDGLADALNESVADAVKDAVGLAVKEAVQAVVAELLTNPQVVAKFAEAHGLTRQPPTEPTQAPAQQKPGWRERMKARWCAVRSAAARAKGWVVAKVAGVGRKVWSSVTFVGRLAAASRKNTAVAVGTGLLVGAGCYWAGPIVASAACGLAASVAIVVAGLLRPLWPLLGMVSTPAEGAFSLDRTRAVSDSDR
jgi:hypothetical protein